MRYADPRLVDELAAAYVLGTLAGRARHRFERLRDARADIALAVRQWEARLGRLSDAVAPVAAPRRVWRAIDERTRPATSAQSGGWWRATWGVSGVLSGVALVLWALLISPTVFMSVDQVALRAGGKLPQSYVGLLTDDAGNGKLLVSSLRNGRTMTVKAIGPIDPPPAGQHLVIWALPAEGAPFVLGTAPLKGSSTSELPDTSERLLAKVAKLAVSVESNPSPASPGRVILRGNCAKLW
ncbi:MAG TPA: anti-sigma factor [Ramlibacter sp.]|nr:anti-sigma factor [Ramlibacter sp.]